MTLENMEAVVSATYPIASVLAIWYIQHSYAKKDKKKEEEIAKRTEARIKENVLIMRMLKAVGKLSFAVAKAAKEGKVNGVMDKALEYYEKANEEITGFNQESCATYLNKEGSA